MPDERPTHLVVVGSSAGGIEALSVLLGAIPADFAAPIVIAQHLDPRRISHLGEILGRRSTIPVVTVMGRQSLRAGIAYVVPADRNVQITDHEVSISRGQPKGSKPSVDRLLETAADIYGENVVAVILTGSGSDGAMGARHVKAAGGTVLIQNPDTAAYPSMPESLATSSVDIIANVDAIGPLLVELVRGTWEPERPDDDRVLQRFLEQVRDRIGIDFAAYKRPTILRRLQRRMLATGSGSIRDYARHVAGHPEEYERLASSFLIKVTEFFRDPELFDYISRTIAPEIVEHGRRHGREIRLWSAGCATGEEAYSLAIAIAEALGNGLSDWTVRIFATDLDNDAVMFARRGIYPASALARVPAHLVRRYFTKLDGSYEVRKQIRTMTVFGQHDLAQRAPFPRIDMVLCRNVLIYFTPDLQRRALQLFAFSLRDGGWLALGKAETTSKLAEHFMLEQSRLKVYRRHGERMVVPSGRRREELVLPSARVGEAGRAGSRLAPIATVPGSGARPSAERSDALLLRLPVGVALVDRNYDVVSMNTAARQLLRIRGAAAGHDLIHLADELPSRQLRAALDAALRGDMTTVTLALEDGASEGTEPATIELEFSPYAEEPEATRPTHALIVVRAAASGAGATQATADSTGRDGGREEASPRIKRMAELNERLIADNEELNASNADLRAANEELLIANEEVQAATEEVETLNEELQATNEELETLNEELQATIEELNTTNDDIAARTLELEGLTVSLDEQRLAADYERARLVRVVETLSDAVLVLDSTLSPFMQNERWTDLFDRHEVAFEDANGEPMTPEALVAQFQDQSSFRIELRGSTRNGPRWFEATGRPMTGEGRDGGLVIVVHDTTDASIRLLQEQFTAVVAHELRTPLTALRGYLQLLRRDAGVDQGVDRYAALALGEAERLQGLVEQLVDVARMETGRLTIDPREVDVVDLVRSTVEIARSLSPDRDIELEVEGEPLIGEVDPERIRQVLFNLLGNAIEHSRSSLPVTVRTRRVKRRIELEVEDRGAGIPEAVRERLFSRYFRGGTGSDGAGLGLGLYISHQIVDGHGGAIEVDTDVGEGTTFTVRLPVAHHERSGTLPAERRPHEPDHAERRAQDTDQAGEGSSSTARKRSSRSKGLAR